MVLSSYETALSADFGLHSTNAEYQLHFLDSLLCGIGHSFLCNVHFNSTDH